MQSPSFIQTLQNTDWRFKHASSLDEVLCFATFVASAAYEEVETVDDARKVWLEDFQGDCTKCILNDACLACIINE